MSEKTLEKLKAQRAQINARIKQENAKIKAQKRKARNHRLIEIGAMLESAIGRPVEKEEMEALNLYFVNQKDWILKGLAKTSSAREI